MTELISKELMHKTSNSNTRKCTTIYTGATMMSKPMMKKQFEKPNGNMLIY